MSGASGSMVRKFAYSLMSFTECRQPTGETGELEDEYRQLLCTL